MTDQQIIESVLKGRTSDFALIIRRYGEAIRNFVRHTIRQRQDAEEVAQDVFVKAFQRLDSYDAEKGSMKSWLLGIAYHEVLMWLRKNQRQTIALEPEAFFEEPTDEEAERLLAEVNEQRIQALQEAIRQLSHEDQMLLQLYYMEDLPLKEIASVAGHDHLYLATRLQRIRKRLCIIIKRIER